MLTIDTLLDTELLARHITDGYVNRREHPTEPLAILNYSTKTQYDRVWDDVTRKCRGLIYNTATQEIVARPFEKFKNYGEHEEGTLPLDAPVVVTDKFDGSLGVLYRLPSVGEYAVATRGSFTSDQAIHASVIWNERYAPFWDPSPGVTYLFEIIYPANRIVVDYGNLDDLVLLDILDTATGLRARDFMWTFPGPWVEEIGHETLAAALEAEPRPNAEGLVVWFPDTNLRVKLKQEDYVALHRIVTGLNERTVWEHIKDGGALRDLIEPLPDEFRPWVTEVALRLEKTVSDRCLWLEGTFTILRGDLDRNHPGWTRKDFAERAMQTSDPWAMFSLLDGKPITERLWKEARPEAVGPAGRVYTEDVA